MILWSTRPRVDVLTRAIKNEVDCAGACRFGPAACTHVGRCTSWNSGTYVANERTPDAL